MMSRRMETLYIVDGMALLYRAFYAFINAPMRTSSGINTSAIFGFTNTLLSILEKEKPTHIVACFDASGPTFRHERYAEYKATRQAMPQELRDSVQPVLEILGAMRIRVLREAGVEADDLIGALTRRVDEMGGAMHAFMVSADKDLGQLLSPCCSLYKPGKKGTEFETVDAAQFCEEWGISSPVQIIDMLALMGDSSDNIPGIPGVGAVTARKLIEQFGSVENLLSHTAELKGKIREKVENNAESARLSYELATIRRDIPLPVDIKDLSRVPFDTAALQKLFAHFEFRGLEKRLQRLEKSSAAAAEGALGPLFVGSEAEETEPVQGDLFDAPLLNDIRTTPHDYRLIATDAGRHELAQRLLSSPRWAFDTETTGLTPGQDRLIGLSFCLQPHEAFYVPIMSEADLEPFRAPFAGEAEKVGLNLKFDLQMLQVAGVSVEGPFFDVMLAHAALYPQLRHGMDELAETLLSYRTVRLKEIAGEECDTASVPPETMCDYAAEDADVTLQLADALVPVLEREGQRELMRRVEFPLLPVLANIELEGMRVKPSLLEESSAELGKQIEALRKRIIGMAGHPINLNSPQQVGELLFGEMKLLAKPKKTRSGQFVTDEETLRKLVGHAPIVADILEYRELSKLKGTYLDALPRFISPVDGRIHSSLLQMVTATGRLASQNPNLQNIPVRSSAGRLIRRAFVSRGKGWSILSADYSQIELRIMAALSGDPSMVDAFIHGRDIHTETAARIYDVPVQEVTPDMRRSAKTVNFGIIYGISSFGLSQRLNCSRTEAAALIENYFNRFPRVKACMDDLIARARSCGYAETLCGRRRALPDLSSANFNLRSAAERTAINTPIQGSAADMIKLAMIRVAELLRGHRTRMIMQIHDELLFDLWDAEAEELTPAIVAAMRSALPLPGDVPLEVDARAADNWLDAH